MDYRELIIMRHAKSDWHSEAGSDFDRPLNLRGIEDAPRMARWLVSANLKPDFIISSPALRAKQTAAEVVTSAGISTDAIKFDSRMYLADLDTLCSIIDELENTHQRVMLIGHNPGLEDLAKYLSKDELASQPDGSLLTTANIIHFRVPFLWHQLEPNKAEFVQIMRPKQLP